MTNIIITATEYRELIEAAQGIDVGTTIIASIGMICLALFLLFKV